MQTSQQFAVEVVRQLRAAGYQALFAGGCVRDQLLGNEPKDYDVATDATPDQVIAAFPNRKTLAIGAAFGVIAVVGPRSAGMVEVATFRRDLAYSDGRRPDCVEFCSPEEDAQRRDFTINGMFYDPLEERVHDYVGGQADLQRGLIRAIGEPRERFTEDKLRLLRAVRFTARFEFKLDEETQAAIQELAPQLRSVSVERISEELRKMLVVPRRAGGVRLLRETNLLQVIFPEWEDLLFRDLSLETDRFGQVWDSMLAELEGLDQPSFPLALAVLLAPLPALLPGGKNDEQLRKEQASRKQQEQPEKDRFTLNDFRKMYEQIRKLGSMGKWLGMIPGMGGLKEILGDENLDETMKRYFAMIDCMTESERLQPHTIEQSRREKIAADSGTQPIEVAELLKQFDILADMMKNMAGKGMSDRMAMMKQMQEMMSNPGGIAKPPKPPRMAQDPVKRFVQQVGRRLKLSNDEIDATSWLVRQQDALFDAATKPWSEVQPLLIMPWAGALLHWSDVRAQICRSPTASLAWCRERLAWPPEQLDPPPILTGDDLIKGGIKPGPLFTGLLAQLRVKQLDGQLTTKDSAWEWLRNL